MKRRCIEEKTRQDKKEEVRGEDAEKRGEETMQRTEERRGAERRGAERREQKRGERMDRRIPPDSRAAGTRRRSARRRKCRACRRREFRYSADAPSPSLLRRLLKGEGGAAEWRSRRRLGEPGEERFDNHEREHQRVPAVVRGPGGVSTPR